MNPHQEYIYKMHRAAAMADPACIEKFEKLRKKAVTFTAKARGLARSLTNKWLAEEGGKPEYQCYARWLRCRLSRADRERAAYEASQACIPAPPTNISDAQAFIREHTRRR